MIGLFIEHTWSILNAIQNTATSCLTKFLVRIHKGRPIQTSLEMPKQRKRVHHLALPHKNNQGGHQSTGLRTILRFAVLQSSDTRPLSGGKYDLISNAALIR